MKYQALFHADGSYICQKILKGMTFDSNEHPHKTENSFKCQVFWARLANYTESLTYYAEEFAWSG